MHIVDIKRACELIKYNLKSISFEEERMALEAMGIKVWIDRIFTTIDGFVPIVEDDRLTQQSSMLIHNSHNGVPFALALKK